MEEEKRHAARRRKSFSFGNPQDPMTIGTFIQWLEEQFEPHDERDEQQSRDIKAVFLAVLGNGKPEHGMQYKVDQMWDIAQKVEHFFGAGRMFWAIVLAFLVAMASAVSIGKSMGWL